MTSDDAAIQESATEQGSGQAGVLEEDDSLTRRELLLNGGSLVAVIGLTGFAIQEAGGIDNVHDKITVAKNERTISIEETEVFSHATHIGSEAFRLWLKQDATTELDVSKLRFVMPDGDVDTEEDKHLSVGQRSALFEIAAGEYTILALTEEEEVVSRTEVVIEVTDA